MIEIHQAILALNPKAGIHVKNNDIKQKAIKDELRTITAATYQKDIFGEPTIVVYNKIF